VKQNATNGKGSLPKAKEKASALSVRGKRGGSRDQKEKKPSIFDTPKEHKGPFLQRAESDFWASWGQEKRTFTASAQRKEASTGNNRKKDAFRTGEIEHEKTVIGGGQTCSRKDFWPGL